MKCGAFLIALALTSGGCSLVALSDDIEQAQCASDDDCEVLNDRDAPDFDPCVVWQCADTLYCERGPLDGDNDGFSPQFAQAHGEQVECVDEPAQIDCADDEELRSPDEPEMCDSLDNDCDARTDEGVLARDPSVVAVFADTNAGGPDDISYAIDPDSGAVAVGYGIVRPSGSVPGLSLIDGSLSSAGAVGVLLSPLGPNSLRANGVGVGALGGDRFVVAFVNVSGQPRVVASVVAPHGDDFDLKASTAQLSDGLRCGESEGTGAACTALADEHSIAELETTTPEVAVQDEHVLIAYARGPSAGVPCGEPTTQAERSRVLVNALRHSGDALFELNEDDPAPALEIGTTSDVHPIAVLAVPAVEEGEDAPGFLIAWSDGEGVLQLQQLRVEDGALTAVGEALPIVSGQPLSDPALTLGPHDADGWVIGVAAQNGCGAGARAIAYRYRADVGSGGELSLQREGDRISVGGRPNESKPSIAFSTERNAWLVAYRDATGLRARALGVGGAPLGSEPYTLLAAVDSGDDELHVTSSPVALPFSAGRGWFAALAATSRANDLALQTVTLSSCASE